MAKITLVLQDWNNQVAVNAYYDTEPDCNHVTLAEHTANEFILGLPGKPVPNVQIGLMKVVKA